MLVLQCLLQNLLLLVLVLLIRRVATWEKGGTLKIIVYYENPGNKLGHGSICDRLSSCDVYFKVCVSHGLRSQNTCDLGQYSTKVFDDTRFVNISNASPIQLVLNREIPELFHLGINVYDEDVFFGDEDVGSFVSKHLPLMPSLEYQPAHLRTTHSSDEIRMEVSYKLVCFTNYYGKGCAAFCDPNAKTYTCDGNGVRNCTEGYTGELCEAIDVCFFQKCAPHAMCIPSGTGRGRNCICNGQDSPECYTTQDRCDPSPCSNDGKCILVGVYNESYECRCTDMWKGVHCQQRRSACKEEYDALLRNTSQMDTVSSLTSVCLNEGTCVDNPGSYGFKCICIANTSGDRCQIKTVNYTIVLTSLLVALLLVIFTILSCIFIRRVLRKRRLAKRSGAGGLIYCHGNESVQLGCISNRQSLLQDGTLRYHGSPGVSRACNSSITQCSDITNIPAMMNTMDNIYEGGKYEYIDESMVPFPSEVQDEEMPPPLPERPAIMGASSIIPDLTLPCSSFGNTLRKSSDMSDTSKIQLPRRISTLKRKSATVLCLPCGPSSEPV